MATIVPGSTTWNVKAEAFANVAKKIEFEVTVGGSSYFTDTIKDITWEGSASNGEIDIASPITLSLPTDATVSGAIITNESGNVIYVNISNINEYFEFGGNFIVTTLKDRVRNVAT